MKKLVMETRYTIINEQEFCIFPGISSARNVKISETFEIPSDPHIACIDSQKVYIPRMTIRKWKPGDHFYPLGMNQKKKLSDYFIDNKYSKFDKETNLSLNLTGKLSGLSVTELMTGLK
jgi:tRNA(Ile)-lysidine synthase